MTIEYQTYRCGKVITIVEMGAKELSPRSEVLIRIGVEEICSNPLVPHQRIIVLIGGIEAIEIIRNRLAHHICGRVCSHARATERVDVGKELLEGINRQKGLSTGILLQVDDNFFKPSCFAVCNEVSDRALERVNCGVKFVEARNTEYRDGGGVEKVS
jgi:hypothetical protein